MDHCSKGRGGGTTCVPSPSHLCLIPADTFETLRQSSIEFNHFLCEIMNERMGVFVGMLEASRLRAPEMRLARALLMLADRKAEGSQEISIPQHELALICGLSRSPSRHEGRLPASHAFGAARCSFDARVCPDAGSGLLY